MDKSEWTRVNDHTLEVTVQDNGPRDLDEASGQIRTGIAPTANTLGGYDESSGNASGGDGGGGGSAGTLLLMLLALLALAGAQRRGRALARGRGASIK